MQAQFQAPPLTKINKIILIIALAIFILASVLKAVGAFSIVSFLGLSGDGVFKGFVFQLITYPFVETGLMSFLFNSMVVWFIGSELESSWGSKVYLRFLVFTTIIVGFVFSFIQITFLHGTQAYFTALHGLSGINFALLIAYSLLFPDRQMAFMMIFPVRSKTFCWIIIGVEIYMAVLSSVLTSWAHLLAMGASFLIIHFQSNPVVNKALHMSLKFSPKKMNKKKHLRVVKDDEKGPPKYWQ